MFKLTSFIIVISINHESLETGLHGDFLQNYHHDNSCRGTIPFRNNPPTYVCIFITTDTGYLAIDCHGDIVSIVSMDTVNLLQTIIMYRTIYNNNYNDI